MRRLVFLLVFCACSKGEYRAARGVYNDGVATLEAQEWSRAEQAFLRARSEAGVDPDLRWRAAFNLGIAYTGDAEAARGGEKPDLEKALSLYATAAGWFQDAIRLRDDEEARANLAIVRARQQAVADELAKDQKALEARLDRLIDGEREVRDGARALLEQARAGGGANPVAFEDEARGLATQERTLLADAGVIVDLAGAEIDSIANKPEDQLTDEDRVRRVQLELVEQWMQIGRTAVSDTRRLLDEGKLEDAHERADEAVEAIKRAREQLLDPIAVLKAIAVDELQVAQQTAYLFEAAKQARSVDKAAAGMPVPPWLTAGHLAGRQLDARSRLDELVQRLKIAVEQPPPEDPAQQRLLGRVKIAVPDLDLASGSMQGARDRLTSNDLAGATAAQEAALMALSRAIEQFVDLRQAIDLTWGEQAKVVALMSGEGEAKDRAKEVREGVARNVGRMSLIEGLIQDEKDAAVKQAEAAKQQDPNAAAPDTQLFDQAETLRAEAAALIAQLAAGKGKGAPLDTAKAAQAKLDELRRLFFSIIEHLQELIRQQGETRDDTATAAGLDDVGRAPLLPGLTQRQGEHRGMGQAIADALAQQADQLAQQPDPQQPDLGQRMGQAAEEVRGALGEMDAASGELAKAASPDLTASLDMTPALDAQKSAIEHLEAALALLQPPQQQQQQDQQQQDQNQDQQQQQEQQQQQQQQQQDQQQSAERRRERVREQEAQRRREREQQQRIESDPVDKDW
jgi:hypothetical protein